MKIPAIIAAICSVIFQIAYLIGLKNGMENIYVTIAIVGCGIAVFIGILFHDAITYKEDEWYDYVAE